MFICSIVCYLGGTKTRRKLKKIPITLLIITKLFSTQDAPLGRKWKVLQ